MPQEPGVSPPSEDAVRQALSAVIDPELGDNIVDLGMVGAIDFEPEQRVVIHLALTIAGCPLRVQLRDDIHARVGALPGVSKVVVRMTTMNDEQRSAVMARARLKAVNEVDNDIPSTTRVLAIASGKGGVGKSSVTVNLAAGLAARGFVVGVLDADIWGFSVPRMLGIDGEIPVVHGKMLPIERPCGAGLLKVLSMGFLSGENEAIMWRGLMLNRAVQHFLEDVQWGELDYLLIDMPPGTGDVQMGLARMLPRAEMVIVTTPTSAAQKVAARAADMARRGYLRVAGVIENMSPSVNADGSKNIIFGEGGGEELASDIGAVLIGQVPLDPQVAAGGDAGVPAVQGAGPAADAFRVIAERIATEVAPPIEMAGCTARMMDAVRDAVREGETPTPTGS